MAELGATLKFWPKPHDFSQRKGNSQKKLKETDNDSKTKTKSKPGPITVKPQTTELAEIDNPINSSQSTNIIAVQAPTPIQTNIESDFSLDLNREQKFLRPYQRFALYRLDPQPQTISAYTASMKGFTLADLMSSRPPHKPFNSETRKTNIEFSSASLTGLSGRGLTTVLANRALTNMQRAQTSIILADSKYHRHNIAQTILDFAAPEQRQTLAERIIVINSIEDLNQLRQANFNANNITYILSTDMLKDFYTTNQSFQQLDNNLSNFSSEHRRLNDYIPLADVKEILIDDVHEYTGFANDGYTKILLSLLRETNSHATDPSTLIGFSSTPYHRKNSVTTNADTLVNFTDLFSELNQIIIPGDYKNSEGSLKTIHPNLINLIGTDSSLAPIATALIGADKHDLLKVDVNGRVQASSINAQLIKHIKSQYRAGQKWRIIADSAEHAKLICQLLQANLPQANPKIFIGELKGAYQLDTSVTTIPIIPIYGADGSETSQIALRAKRESELDILNSFESTNPNTCDILVELETSQKYHNPQVTHVVHANLNDSDSALLRSLGHACTRNSNGGNIEFQFLTQQRLAQCQNYLNNGVSFRPIAKNSARSQGVVTPTPGQDTNVTVRIVRGALLEAHEYWQERGLMPLIRIDYPDDDLDTALTKMASDLNFGGRTIDEIKEIIRGHRIDHKLFGQFLERRGLNPEEVATYAPELVGINNETQARRSFEFALREMMDDREFTKRINWGWHEHLDRNLGIVPALDYNRAIALRARNFAEIIYAKLGAEYFEDRAFVRHAISVFSGVAKDTKLLGLLINSVPRMDFNEAIRLYPDLTGPIPYIPFERVQKMLQAKYPQGPDSDLDKFFKQTIYDDFGIDFAVLVNSITDYHRESDQPIIANSARELIAEFLTKTYSTAAGDNSNHSYTQAMEHFNDISREILYNQILAKVWGINRILTITNDDFKHTIQADRIDSESQAASALEQAIDLNNTNLQWIERINIAIQSKIPSTNLSLSLRKRVAIALENFTNKGEYRNNLDTEFRTNEDDVDTKTVLRSEQNLLGELNIDQHTINVLTGAVNPNELKDSDKDLFRDFAQSLDIGSEELITNFPRLAGIKNQEEATLVVKNTLAGMDEKELQPNSRLIAFIGDPAKNPELVAEFLLTRYPDTLLDREGLKAALKLINGDFRTSQDKASNQAYLREYISFLADKTKDSPSPIRLRDVVVALPKLTGINDKPELIDAIKFEGRFDLNSVTKTADLRKDHNVLNKILELGENLGLELASMRKHAGLTNLVGFYTEPITQGYKSAGQTPDQAIIQKELISKQDVIFAKELLRTVYGDQYSYIVSEKGKEVRKTVSTGINIKPFNIKIEGDHLTLTTTSERNLLKEKPGKAFQWSTKYNYEYQGGQWVTLATEREGIIDGKPIKISSNDNLNQLREKIRSIYSTSDYLAWLALMKPTTNSDTKIGQIFTEDLTQLTGFTIDDYLKMLGRNITEYYSGAIDKLKEIYEAPTWLEAHKNFLAYDTIAQKLKSNLVLAWLFDKPALNPNMYIGTNLEKEGEAITSMPLKLKFFDDKVAIVDAADTSKESKAVKFENGEWVEEYYASLGPVAPATTASSSIELPSASEILKKINDEFGSSLEPCLFNELPVVSETMLQEILNSLQISLEELTNILKIPTNDEIKNTLVILFQKYNLSKQNDPTNLIKGLKPEQYPIYVIQMLREKLSKANENLSLKFYIQPVLQSEVPLVYSTSLNQHGIDLYDSANIFIGSQKYLYKDSTVEKASSALASPSPLQREITQKFEEHNIPELLLKGNAATDLNELMLPLTQHFNLSTKEIFNQIGIGSMVDSDGSINKDWTDAIISFVDANIQEENIRRQVVLSGWPIVGSLINIAIMRIKSPNQILKILRVGFPIVDPRDIDLILSFTTHGQIEIVQGRHNGKEKVLASAPIPGITG